MVPEYLKLCVFRWIGFISIVLFCCASKVYAATPVVDNTITVEKTGSEPFDAQGWTGDGPGGADGGVNDGQDASEDDNIVRVQDSITYRVEVSVNDGAVSDLTSTVTLNEKQKWLELPSGCKTDPIDVGTQPISSISADETVLFCNMGPAIEGTTRVFFPTARATGTDPITGDVTRNDDIVTTTVTSQAFSAENGDSNIATAGDTEVIVTGTFKVDLNMRLNTNVVDEFGNPLYQAPNKIGPPTTDGSARPEGTIIEFVVEAVYRKGSLFADGDLDTSNGGQPGVANYRVIDVLTDDNERNDVGGISTQAMLYDWDAGLPACILNGDHGVTSAVNCSVITANIDDVGPAGTGPDGVNDLVIQIDLTDIDVADPNNDSKLFEVIVHIWFDRADDLESHQVCDPLVGGGGDCINTVTNRVGLWDEVSTRLQSFDEVNDSGSIGNNLGLFSTEDASGTRLGNFSSGEEPFPNEENYPLIYTPPGGFTAHKMFTDPFPFNLNKFPDQEMAAGETRPFSMNAYDFRKIDQAEATMCDKIDTQVFEYAGIAPPFQTGSPRLTIMNRDQPWSVVMGTFGGTAEWITSDGSDFTDFLYTNHPYVADPLVDQAAYISEMRTATCEDDLNGGGVVIQKTDGSLVDENGNSTSGDIDWWEDSNAVPPFGGGAGATANVTRVRQDSRYDAAAAIAQDPTHFRHVIAVNHMIKAKFIPSSPYGANNRLPNFASFKRQEADGSFSVWFHAAANTEDPNADGTFSVVNGTADRMTLISSAHSIEKYTSPRGVKVVRGGDNVDFILGPKLFGGWTDTLVNTAEVEDDLPNGTNYVANSEMFSSDAGTTWYTRADWDARFLAGDEDVSVISAPHIGGADPLLWEFGSLNSTSGGSDQLPLIKYTVAVDAALVSGGFTNTAEIDSGTIGGTPKTAAYQLTILPELGMDIFNKVDSPVYSINSPFSVDLVYKNLGGEDYTAGEYINIFAYNGDSTVTTGGVNSARSPATNRTGEFDVVSVTQSNGETFFATAVDPSSLEEDPCHASNLPLNYVPSPTNTAFETCSIYFEREGLLPGGGSVGTNSAGWEQCTSLNPLTCGTIDNTDITALKFSAPSLPAAQGGQTVTVNLQPLGNLGGIPNIDSQGLATGASTGDVYTNSFAGRISDISLAVVSNDVAVTFVSGSIGDTIWWDDDQDGNGPAGAGDESDVTEQVISGVKVELLDASSNPIFIDPDSGGIVSSGYVNASGTAAIPYEKLTDSNGQYLFEGIPAATYVVRVTPPPGATPTFDADGVGTPNLSTHDLLLETDSAGVTSGVEDNTGQDFGYLPPVSIGGFVWDDLDGQGVQNANEPSLSGAVATLWVNNGTGTFIQAVDTSATAVGSVTTGLDGYYIFGGLPDGDYKVRITPPGSYTPSFTQNDTSNDDTANDSNIASELASSLGTYESAVFTLTSGSEPTGVNENERGDDQDSGVFGPDENSNLTVDFGFMRPAKIGDKLWIDLDKDGIQDANEGRIGGATVNLTPPSTVDLGNGLGMTVSTVTDPNGNYVFLGLPPLQSSGASGGYVVSVDTATIPAGYIQTYDEGDGLGASDNTSAPIYPNPGEFHDTADFGYVPEAGAIGDRIWVDANGVPVTMVTDSSGNYLFSGLTVGEVYVVAVNESTLPAGFVSDADGDGDPDVRDGNSSVADGETLVSLTAQEDVILDADFGYLPPNAQNNSVGDTVWFDTNSDGVIDANEVGIGDVTIDLLDGTSTVINTIVTDVNGFYSFTGIPDDTYTLMVTDTNNALDGLTPTFDFDGINTPNVSVVGVDSNSVVFSLNDNTLGTPIKPTSVNEPQQDFGFVNTNANPGIIGDTIFFDADEDGFLGAGEGLQGVVVQLLDSNGNLVGSATTDANGNYLFDNLPVSVAGETYSVVVDTNSLPNGGVGWTNTIDPDGIADSNSSVLLTNALPTNINQDFGYESDGQNTITGTVWNDVDGNGSQEESGGFGGVTIELRDANGNVIASTVTDGNGDRCSER